MAKQEEATVVVFDVSQHSCGQVRRCIESIVLQKVKKIDNRVQLIE